MSDSKQKLDWSSPQPYAKGKHAAIAINSQDLTIVLHQTEDSGELYYSLGKAGTGMNTPTKVKSKMGNALRADYVQVAINADNAVIIIYKYLSEVMLLSGIIQGDSVMFGEPLNIGIRPSGKFDISLDNNNNFLIVAAQKHGASDASACLGQISGNITDNIITVKSALPFFFSNTLTKFDGATVTAAMNIWGI